MPCIDVIRYSVQDSDVIRRLVAYIVPGINSDDLKEVLTIEIDENESAKYWLSVLNGSKGHRMRGILFLRVDELAGIKEAITTAFPRTEYQKRIVHRVRNTSEYVSDKDRKPFATDLRMICQASIEEKALEALEWGTKKQSEKYPNSMKSWHQNWDAIIPIFKFSTTVRKIIYTTDVTESLNATYRKPNRQGNVFPSDTVLLEVLYSSTFEATKKRTMLICNWGQVYGELNLMHEGRPST